ncbi:MAG: ABC transporter permease [Sphaerochaetaceae bacterium]|jgi:rhamnose transport system permease protein|nr:ABC transporter permease [Sphaerochaetaceae bacterium]NLO60797.1 ABC transporter permease [Spirochaetales bacterium]MDD2407160.1 ABC transporter permease [Sphaerochaetaceae bacterium]MDD3671276.1 ABC transporter permease [Sphaerochaetaceae bacterium]MDD4258695.1 ABC transporter permease [Sphaerochaetaceae bacterium]
MAQRELLIERQRSMKRFIMQWEWLLLLIFMMIHVVNSFLSPYYLNFNTFIRTPMTFLDKSFLVLPMTFVIILGNIDISVGSTVALSSVIMATAYNAGVAMPLAMLLCLVVATTCGLINGVLMVKFKELSAVIVTLSTMTIYRGVAYVILEDRAAGNFPNWFSFLGWGSIAGIPFMLIMFVICAVLFGILLHKTTFGRKIFGIGNNKNACIYSGIETNRVLLWVSILTGLMAGFTALFLTSRMGSTRPNVAQGYELEVIAMVVLGGVSTAGGKGKIIGPVLAIFIIGFLSYGLGLVNISAQVLLIIIGMLLIISTMILNIRFKRMKKPRVLQS